MPLATKDTLCRYGFAIAITLAITWVRVLLSDSLGERIPFGLHYISILVAAWIGGTGPACLALVLGVVTSTLFVYSSIDSFELHDPGDLLSLSLYSIVGVAAIAMIRRSETQQASSSRHAEVCEAMSAELGEADRRKDEFLALLAHELRNPLATLVAGIDAIERTDEEESVGRDIVRSMRRQLDHLVVLVNDLLDVSRYLRGGLSLTVAPIDLRDVIDAAIQVASPQIDARQHDLRYTRPTAAIVVEGDEVRLTQVLVNLLTNAAKYTPPKGHIHILCETEGSDARVHVIDNGVGIAAKDQQAVFDLFQQINPGVTRDGEGLGIGLALVKQLVDLHGGDIRVTSEGSGRGSRFTVVLARVNADRLPTAVEQPMKVTRDSPATEGMQVLVIDDNADAAQMLATLLRLEGYRVEVANDGHAGIQQATRLRPEVILLDIGMPGIDGYETARQIRAGQDFPAPRIIAVSGWGSATDRQRSRESGIDYHMTKPVEFEKLVATMQGQSETLDAGVGA